MASNRIMYQVVGRYMNGPEVVGYHLQSIETGKSRRYTKEQFAFLVGRGQVTNCDGQINEDKMLFRGVGISLNDLPVVREDGTVVRTDNIGNIRRGTTAEQAITQFTVIKSIVSGTKVIGYVVRNAGGGTKNISRDDTFKLAKLGRIGNMRCQEYNGKVILRGVNTDLNALPKVQASELRQASEN
ncbi:MAG: hypothetical protein IJ593_05910 [Lachnospiraceae bacterium]|nr:hypothetical protein [Lachnospiraceae bacterium]